MYPILRFFKNFPDLIKSKFPPKKWHSLTNEFNQDELDSIHNLLNTDMETSIQMLLNSDPVVALRALAEVRLNAGIYSSQLKTLLEHDNLSKHWTGFMFDYGVTSSDLKHSTDLLAVAKQTCPEKHKTLLGHIKENMVKKFQDL